MTKTQIQLPDPLYQELKRVSREQDWSLAEVLRRGAEYVVRCYPKRELDRGQWKLPAGKDLGGVKVPYTDWREIAADRAVLDSH
jgi:hypothetical protein